MKADIQTFSAPANNTQKTAAAQSAAGSARPARTSATKLQATSRQTRFNPAIENKRELDLHDVSLAILSTPGKRRPAASAATSASASASGTSTPTTRTATTGSSGTSYGFASAAGSSVSSFSASSIPTLPQPSASSSSTGTGTGNGPAQQKDILRDVHLKLNPGVRYVLHGVNGVGKSTLLRAIGERAIPGIPWSMKILLLQQEATEETEEHKPGLAFDAGSGKDQMLEDATVLAYVVASDKERTEAVERSEALSAAIEDTSDPEAALRVVRRIKHEDASRQLEIAQKEADLRSGSRGMAARKHLKVMEAALEESMSKLSISEEDDLLAGMNEAVSIVSDLTTKLDLMSAETAQARAVTILKGLGFTEERLGQKVSTLSGGWRMRTKLASVLFQPCDLLLLDEPTNFLDFSSLLWLEDYLSSTFGEDNPDAILLMVSHDRAFVDKIAEQVILLRDYSLEAFPGNLTEYYAARAEKKRNLIKLKDAHDRQVAHMEKTIAGNVRAAKQSGDDKKLKQAVSRQKKLDNRMGIQTNSKGGRFKVSKDRPGYHLTARDEIVIPQDEAGSKFKIRKLAEGTRFVGTILSCEDLSFTYKSNAAPTFQGFNLSLRLGEKVAFVGENGAGKSTLISCLVDGNGDSISSASASAAAQPSIISKGKMSGTLTKQAGASVGYFSQTVVDELSSPQYLAMSALQYIHLGSEQETRAALASLGLVGKTVSDLPISALSGGQKVRVALCRILYPATSSATGAPAILVLDEVTTHLDADTVQALARQLRAFRGALILVSHDRWFVQAVVERGDDEEEEELNSSEDSEDDEAANGGLSVSPGIVYWVNKGKVRKLGGGVDEFEEKIRKRAAKQLKAAS